MRVFIYFFNARVSSVPTMHTRNTTAAYCSLVSGANRTAEQKLPAKTGVAFFGNLHFKVCDVARDPLSIQHQMLCTHIMQQRTLRRLLVMVGMHHPRANFHRVFNLVNTCVGVKNGHVERNKKNGKAEHRVADPSRAPSRS